MSGPRLAQAPARIRRLAGRIIRRRASRTRAVLRGRRLVGAARRDGERLGGADRAFLVELEARLSGGARPRIALLRDGAGRDWGPALRSVFPRARIREYDVGLSAEQIHVAMAGDGRFDVIVADTAADDIRGELVIRVFFHLRPGGALLARLHRRDNGAAPGQDHRELAQLLQRAMVRKLAAGGEDGPVARHVRRVARAVDEVKVAGRHVVLTNSVRAFAKVTEGQANVLLRDSTAPRGTVVTTLPAAELRSRCELHESDSPRAGRFPGAYTAPEVSLRCYESAACLPGQVVLQRNVVLPDTYRHNQRPRLRNGFTEELGGQFARPKDGLRDVDPISGAYFYLDSEFRGHYGHLLTEQLSRLWAWQQAKAADPGLKALLAVNRKRRRIYPYEVAIFGAAGIAPEDIVLVDRPVRVERLYAATPMLSQPAYVHPAIRATWDRVSDALAAQAPDRDYPKRIFCARQIAKRPCTNAAEVEEFFAGRGFEVLYPERFSVPEQARIFREADVIAGFAGSALFNTCFSSAPKHVVSLASETYSAQNEYMIASVIGHRLDVVWCRAEIAPRPGGWDPEVFHSPFRCDLDRAGRFLDEQLGLGR